jgi:hypothetical protein
MPDSARAPLPGTVAPGQAQEKRLHGEIGDVPPAQHEAGWYRHNPAAREAVTN